ncbi:MAG TPA: hypothetical protein VMU27_02665 [Candidatus Paceibacterota bacterium]|nr:hypothetical protein [Candidatus Paceibacterota bacterium]
MQKHTLSAVAFVIAVFLLVIAFNLAIPQRASSDSSANHAYSINGYAWSGGGSGSNSPETSGGIGWISFNCETGGPNGDNICTTSNYGMTVDNAGTLKGDAWSDNIGWISANAADLSGCPKAPCTATIDFSTGKMTGWMRALSGKQAQSGGWDGWISLSGNGYGVAEDTSTGQFFSDDAHDAWGGRENVGWVNFADASLKLCTPGTQYMCSPGPGKNNTTIKYITTNPDCSISTGSFATCTPPAWCTDGSSSCQYDQPAGTFTVTPLLVVSGGTAEVTWSMTKVGPNGCTVTGTNGDSWSGNSGDETTSGIMGSVTYTLSCDQEDPSESNYTQSITVGTAPTYHEH